MSIAPRRVQPPAFTLIELLVVIAIISLLVTILVPSLARAKDLAKASVCRSNLHNLGTGMVLYQSPNNDLVIPSYNMSGVSGGADVPLDGWAPILDRDKLISGSRENNGSLFVCPSMLDIEGMASGQTGTDPDKPKGWMDWPNLRMGTANVATTIPQWGFHKIIRVGYWINADNPIGGATTVENEVYYTASVGYGPGTNGLFLKQTRGSAFRHPGRLIALADGVYAGRQRDVRIGTTNCRIGYRHTGQVGVANVAYADGHVGPMEGDKFPRGKGGSTSLADLQADNSGSATVFADPEKALGF